jgi:hypothetical protein
MATRSAPRRRATTRKDPIPLPEPSRSQYEEIARRAFEIFLSRGGDHGRDLDDWLQAERDILARASRRES